MQQSRSRFLSEIVIHAGHFKLKAQAVEDGLQQGIADIYAVSDGLADFVGLA